MARPLNGTLFVNEYTATGNPGEYTFTNGVFSTFTDVEGVGAYGITTG